MVFPSNLLNLVDRGCAKFQLACLSCTVSRHQSCWPSAVEIAGQKPAQTLIVVRLGEIRPRRKCALVTLQRFAEPLERMQGNAVVGVRFRIVGPKRQRTIVLRHCLVEPLQHAQGVAAVGVRLGIIGP